jgi:hypothetical protein
MPSLDLSFTYSDAVNSHFASHCMGKPIEWYLDKETCKKCQGTEVSGQQPVRNWGQKSKPWKNKIFSKPLELCWNWKFPQWSHERAAILADTSITTLGEILKRDSQISYTGFLNHGNCMMVKFCYSESVNLGIICCAAVGNNY